MVDLDLTSLCSPDTAGLVCDLTALSLFRSGNHDSQNTIAAVPVNRFTMQTMEVEKTRTGQFLKTGWRRERRNVVAECHGSGRY